MARSSAFWSPSPGFGRASGASVKSCRACQIDWTRFAGTVTEKSVKPSWAARAASSRTQRSVSSGRSPGATSKTSSSYSQKVRSVNVDGTSLAGTTRAGRPSCSLSKPSGASSSGSTDSSTVPSVVERCARKVPSPHAAYRPSGRSATSTR